MYVDSEIDHRTHIIRSSFVGRINCWVLPTCELNFPLFSGAKGQMEYPTSLQDIIEDPLSRIIKRRRVRSRHRSSRETRRDDRDL